MSFEAMNSSETPGASDYETVRLTPQDIPSTQLDEPFEKHTIVKLRQWLLCRGIKAPTAWKKSRLVAGWAISYASIVCPYRCTLNRTIALLWPCSIEMLHAMPDIPYRVHQAKREDTPIVDGSFVYKKYRSLVRDGKHVVAPSVPSFPLPGWRVVNKDSYLVQWLFTSSNIIWYSYAF